MVYRRAEMRLSGYAFVIFFHVVHCAIVRRALNHGLFMHILVHKFLGEQDRNTLLLAQRTEAQELQKLPSQHSYTE